MLHICGAATHHSESALYRLQRQMIALTRSVLKHGGDVVGFEIRILRDNFFATGTRRKQIQHITHADAHATNAGRPLHCCGSNVMRFRGFGLGSDTNQSYAG